jgi:O-antigen/teichoic acid export membrane protein
MRNLDRKALRRSIWSSLSRVIGIGLSAGAGSMIHRMVGDGLEGWGLASVMAIVSFALMAFAEYEREML